MNDYTSFILQLTQERLLENSYFKYCTRNIQVERYKIIIEHKDRYAIQIPSLDIVFYIDITEEFYIDSKESIEHFLSSQIDSSISSLHEFFRIEPLSTSSLFHNSQNTDYLLEKYYEALFVYSKNKHRGINFKSLVDAPKVITNNKDFIIKILNDLANPNNGLLRKIAVISYSRLSLPVEVRSRVKPNCYSFFDSTTNLELLRGRSFDLFIFYSLSDFIYYITDPRNLIHTILDRFLITPFIILGE